MVTCCLLPKMFINIPCKQISVSSLSILRCCQVVFGCWPEYLNCATLPEVPVNCSSRQGPGIRKKMSKVFTIWLICNFILPNNRHMIVFVALLQERDLPRKPEPLLFHPPDHVGCFEQQSPPSQPISAPRQQDKELLDIVVHAISVKQAMWNVIHNDGSHG